MQFIKRTFLTSAMAIMVCAMTLVACSQSKQFDDVYVRVTEATLQPGTAIPEPKEEVILTVSGKIGTTNVGESIEMDRTTIEQVGTVEYDVQDPFADEQIRYTGVLMRDLLDLWQVPGDVEGVKLTALNDYQIEIPIDDFHQYPILFAMQADGQYMEPDYQGPAMLVYPVDDYEFDTITLRRRWIWQIRTIELY